VSSGRRRRRHAAPRTGFERRNGPADRERGR